MDNSSILGRSIAVDGNSHRDPDRIGIPEVSLNFFESMAMEMAKQMTDLQILPYSINIGRLADETRTSIQTLAAWTDGKIQPNYQYRLAETPCAHVLQKGSALHAAGVARQFPNHHYLTTAAIEAYVGVVLENSHKEAMGLIMVLFQQPLEKQHFIQSIVQYFCDRCAIVLEREKSEANNQKLAMLVESSHELIGTANLQGQVTYMNQAGLNLVGLDSLEAARKLRIIEFIPSNERNCFFDQVLPQILQQGSWKGSGHLLHFKTNNILDVDITVFLVGGDTIAAVMRDISAQKRAEEEKKGLEEQLYQSQKMESLGRLAGGIAHDFNNILTSIMGYAELLKFKFSDIQSTEGKAVDIIFQGAERAARLTQQLLGFARKGSYRPRPLDINQLIRQTVRVSEKIFEKNIHVRFILDPMIATIEADRNLIDQVMTNLFINARDAMPQGGELTIQTENIVLNHEALGVIPDLPPGAYVKITLTDTGCGIPPDIIDCIFEPFFTTKKEGQGTGLGLATVYGITRKHHGHVCCVSKVGQGTTFILYLPTSQMTPVPESEERESVMGQGTILVVDDEEFVRNMIKQMLESLGYEVLLARDGNEALNIYRQSRERIKLVLLDMIMPKPAGKETFLALKALNPQIVVLLVSGYSREGKIQELLDTGVAGFIQKPFKRHDLSRRIAEVLQHDS
jgi:PAS domain S-box-containing protein